MKRLGLILPLQSLRLPGTRAALALVLIVATSLPTAPAFAQSKVSLSASESASSESQVSDSSSSSRASADLAFSSAPSSTETESVTSESSNSTGTSEQRAANPDSSTGSSSAARVPFAKGADMTTLRLSMAESVFALDPSLENRANLILAIERVVEESCMPRLTQTLQHLGMNSLPAPQKESCRKQLFALFALDGASPTGFCARDGIDSANCAAAYKNQVSGSYGGGYVAPTTPEALRPGMKATAQDQAALLYQELRQRKAALLDHESIEGRIAIRTLYARLLTINCAVVRLALQELPPQEAMAASNRDSMLGRPLDPNVPIEQYVDVLVQGARAKATPTGGPSAGNPDGAAPTEGPPFFRNRLTSDACQFYVREGLQFEPGFAAPICHSEGFSSPQCITALRKEQIETQAAIQKSRQVKGLPPLPPPGARPPKAPGFSTF